jgi:two-component system phosphate regulon response regulator PhoB
MSTKILVVDDEQDMVELLAWNLKERGYQVLTAATGLEALNKARQHLPELILLDLMLDGIDGFSVCEILRDQPSTATVPVIIITALAGQIARLNGLAAGANDFVTKPFSPAELMTRIERVLKAREERIRRMSDEGIDEFTNDRLG